MSRVHDQPPPQEMNRMEGQQQQQSNVIIVNQQQVQRPQLLVGPEGTRDWTTGLFDFTADGDSCE